MSVVRYLRADISFSLGDGLDAPHALLSLTGDRDGNEVTATFRLSPDEMLAFCEGILSSTQSLFNASAESAQAKAATGGIAWSESTE